MGAWGQAVRVVLSVDVMEGVRQASAMVAEEGAAAHQEVAKQVRVANTAMVAGRAMVAGIVENELEQMAARKVVGWVEVLKVTAAETMGVGLKAAEMAATVVVDD